MNKMLRANVIGVVVYSVSCLAVLAVANCAFGTLSERNIIFGVLAVGDFLGLVWGLAVGWRGSSPSFTKP